MELKRALKKYPIAIRRTRDKNLLMETRLEIAVHKKRNHKFVVPDGDLLPVAEELFGARFAGADVFQDRLSSVSLSGILRALSVFKITHPKEYKTLVTLMHVLSYSFDRNMSIPPLYILKFVTVRELEDIWKRVEELTGIDKETYSSHIAEEFTRRRLDEHYALLYPDEDEDSDAVLTLLERDREEREQEEGREKKKLPLERIFPGFKQFPVDEEDER